MGTCNIELTHEQAKKITTFFTDKKLAKRVHRAIEKGEDITFKLGADVTIDNVTAMVFIEAVELVRLKKK